MEDIFPKYINPITKIYPNFKEAKESFDRYGGFSMFEDVKGSKIEDLVKGNRNLIVGEPGVGKSLLMRRMSEHLSVSGYETELIPLRTSNLDKKIDAFLAKETEKPKALLLDALDEVKSDKLPEIIAKIEEISLSHPELPLYISSRWIFINRYSNSFPEYRYITLPPFTQGQVQEYLKAAGHSEKDIEELRLRIVSFGHSMLVIQTPRYLFYLEDYLKNNGVDAATKVSRNDLFEYFIYKKLEHEDIKLNSDKKAITKRVLEKLALTMEIYQTNTFTKDELMTFFDELKSELTAIALTQIDLEIFYDCSLLKNNITSIEFDNAEFQEYLAAKEISRFPDPAKAAAALAIDEEAKEIHPSWFNALTFLVDMYPELLSQLIDFSGMRSLGFKVMDEAFLNFLSRVDPRRLTPEVRKDLFELSIDYHENTLQWIPGRLASALPGFYDPTLEQNLKTSVENAEQKTGTARFVPLGNIAYIVAYLLRAGVSVDTAFWRKKLIEFVSDENDNGVLQRHALLALEELKDPSVIDELPNLSGKDQLVYEGFLGLCTEIAPDHPTSIAHFISAIKSNNFHGRYGLFAMKEKGSLKKFLQAFIDDSDFRREFLDDSRIFRDTDRKLIDRIVDFLDEEIIELSMKALVEAVHMNVAHDAENSALIKELWVLLRARDSDFVPKMVDRIKSTSDGKNSLYFSHAFFAQIIEKDDVESYLQAMIEVDERWVAFNVMARIRHSGKKEAEEIYEAGRKFLKEEYEASEQRSSEPDPWVEKQNAELIREFKTRLEPAPGQYDQSVFDFYNDNLTRLDPLITEVERDRLRSLITGTVFKLIDPAKSDLKITSEGADTKTYTTSSAIHLFGEAIITAKQLGVDPSQFRQHILNYIPFAFHDKLAAIFDLVKDVQPQEMEVVLEVYKDRKSDLWRHRTDSFIDAIEQYHILEATPLLRGFITEPLCDKYAREKALSVLDQLAPDPAFLKEIADKYAGSETYESRLADIANGLLITNHADPDAIRNRLKQIVDHAAAFTRPEGVHSVSDLEDEISHDKRFAKPLMDLKYSGYEEDYLNFLDQAMEIWARGKDFQAYSEYMWGIVYAYFDNLKETRSYAPLRQLEERIATMRDKEGANWLASRMSQLRRSYLAYVGKPRTASEAIQKYNAAKEIDNRKIQTSDDLFAQIESALQKDLRQWIEGEGAYKIIVGEKVFDRQRQGYEKLIQQTIKPQIENILLRRGFNVQAYREAELLDGKKVDFLVRYGFIGPVLIEVKLTSNTDLKGTAIDQSPSYKNVERYMNGYEATHGIVLIIKNDEASNLELVRNTFQQIPRVSVISFDTTAVDSEEQEPLPPESSIP